MTETERDKLYHLADQAGLSISDYVVRRALKLRDRR